VTDAARPSRATRRRLRIAAASVFGIVVVTTMVAATELQATEEPRSAGTRRDVAVAAEPGIPLPRVNWTLRWSDEFTGRGLSSKWVPVSGNGTNGWSHRALQYYRPANAQQDGLGHLVITAAKTGRSTALTCWNGPCEYTSGRVESRETFSQRYGRMAARIKLPDGKGIWPAFWTRSRSSSGGEIDIVEPIGSKPNLVQGFTHGKGHKGIASLKLAQPFSAAYHVYGVDWTPQGIVWWMDGKPYGQFKYSGYQLDQPHWIILNVQVGGNYPKPPNAATRFPARMEVDWVRVYSGAAR
jgi:beta-glucanase (GH16 family)